MKLFLTQYRKFGGFSQLITLLESCDGEKKNQFMNLIAQEDPGWARLLKTKILTIERILSWPDVVLEEILPQLNFNTIVICTYGLNPVQRQKIITNIPSEWSENFKKLGSNQPPTVEQTEAAKIAFVKTVREMELRGLIRFDLIDPELNIESKLVA